MDQEQSSWELRGFKNYNDRNTSTKRVLFVMADADNKTVEQRIADITSGCDPKPSDGDNVCFVIPRWAVETWIKYLRGESVNESDQTGPRDRLNSPQECWPAVKQLKDVCDSSDPLPESAPDSLRKACAEFQRIRTALQS